MKLKKIAGMAAVSITALALVGCGPRVEVGSAQVGKIKTKAGFEEGFKETSKFRMSSCWMPGSVCDTLVLMDVGDHEISETMSLVMPQDRLKMHFTIGGTLSIREGGYQEIFANIPAQKSEDHTETIGFRRVYNTYAKKIINAETREFMSGYSIDEIMANRDKIGTELASHLKDVVENRTPFKLRYVGVSDVDYPDVITASQEKAAERKEQVRQEKAQVEVTRVKLERELEETRLNRKISVEKADAEAEVNRILGDSITDRYVEYRRLEALDKFAASENTKVVPISMLDSIASDVMLGNETSR